MSEEKPNEEMSPAEKYKLTMKQVREDNAAARGDGEPEDAEEDLDAFEEEDELESEEDPEAEGEDKATEEGVRTIDKSLGEEKLPVTEMTIEQHQKGKVEQSQKEAITALRSAQNSANKKLSPQDAAVVNAIVNDVANGIIKDPVLVHLVKQKAKLHKEAKDASGEIAKLQQRLMDEVTNAANNMVMKKGALENIDAQILEVAADTKKE